MARKTRAQKINFYITLFVRISLIIAIPIAFWEQNWIFIFLSFLTFVLTFLPTIIERTYKVKIPSEINLIIVLFIYAGIFLGGVREFYHIFWWWDSLLHLLAGIGLGFAGFLVLYILDKSGKIKASPLTIALFAFCFALAMGTVWEIFEFSVDQILGYDMQRARWTIDEIKEFGSSRIAIMDTMVDLILDAVGALIASIAGYFYLKTGKTFIFDKFIEKFERENEKLFNKQER